MSLIKFTLYSLRSLRAILSVCNLKLSDCVIPVWLSIQIAYSCFFHSCIFSRPRGCTVEAANDVLLVDLLRRFLDVNRDERITANDAVRHDRFDSKIFESNRAADSNSNRISKLRRSLTLPHCVYAETQLCLDNYSLILITCHNYVQFLSLGQINVSIISVSIQA